MAKQSSHGLPISKSSGALTFALLAATILAGGGVAQEAKQKIVPEAEQGEGVSLTVYNQNFVVVRERRMLELPRGRSDVQFRDVAATIIPESVQFTNLTTPDGARVIDQSYLFDLVSAYKLLDKFLDQEIAAVTGDGEIVRGRLLSFDSDNLTLQTPGGIEVIPRKGNVESIQFPTLPQGLLSRPTLAWNLESKQAGKQLCKVAYLARGMIWQVEYRARINAGFDRLDLAAWVSVTNETGTSFKDARLRLLAGSVRIDPKDSDPAGVDKLQRGSDRKTELIREQIQEQSFADYHVYDLPRKVTLAESSTKQIELFDISSVPVVHKYVAGGHSPGVSIVAEFKNSTSTHKDLGIPLPFGTVRVFQNAKDGSAEFVGQDSLDHTPKEEQVRFVTGKAFDLKIERDTLATRGTNKKLYVDRRIRLRNHKSEAVTIEVVEALESGRDATITANSQPLVRRNANTVVFDVPIPANAEAVVTYTVRYE